MKKTKLLCFVSVFVIINILFTGCWDYKEVDEFIIVAGVAVDKGDFQKYKLTVETILVSGGASASIQSKTFSVEGDTMFDAARNFISVTGKKLYWAHTKAIVISDGIAEAGLMKTLEWYNRDAETREDVSIFISKEKTAGEIFTENENPDLIISETLRSSMNNQKNLSTAVELDLLNYDKYSRAKGMSPLISVVSLVEENDKKTPKIEGSAIIKDDKLIGWLSPEETKKTNFLKDEIEGGIIVQDIEWKEKPLTLSLEIFESKTKVTPVIEDGIMNFNVDIKTIVAVAEIQGQGQILTVDGLKNIKETTENTIEEELSGFVKYVQQYYATDIFGLGREASHYNYRQFESFENNWDDNFVKSNVNINVEIQFKNPALLAENVKDGE